MARVLNEEYFISVIAKTNIKIIEDYSSLANWNITSVIVRKRFTAREIKHKKAIFSKLDSEKKYTFPFWVYKSVQFVYYA